MSSHVSKLGRCQLPPTPATPSPRRKPGMRPIRRRTIVESYLSLTPEGTRDALTVIGQVPVNPRFPNSNERRRGFETGMHLLSKRRKPESKRTPGSSKATTYSVKPARKRKPSQREVLRLFPAQSLNTMEQPLGPL